jgi:uncharacterized protein DUF6496
MQHIRERKHGAANTKQAIAIGLSKARRAGVELPQASEGSRSQRTRKQALRDSRKGAQGNRRAPSRTRSRAVSSALKREGHSAASPANLSRQAAASRRRNRLLVQDGSQHRDYEVRKMRSAFIQLQPAHNAVVGEIFGHASFGDS